MGGDKLYYDGEPSSSFISLLNTKIFLNSVISDADKGATFSIADIKNHCLQNIMEMYQYMKIPLKYLTRNFCNEYDIHNLAHNGYINIEIRKGMHGLKEVDILAFNYIVKKSCTFWIPPG